jgi:hypothetical protein
MNNLNKECFVKVYDGVSLCIKAAKYQDFNVQTGMIVIDKELASKALFRERFKYARKDDFYTVVQRSLTSETDEVILSYFDEDFPMIWTKENGEWIKKYYVFRDEYIELLSVLQEAYETYNVRAFMINVPPKDELYQGRGFKITDVIPGERCNNGGAYGFYTSYRETGIPGLYEVETSCTCDFDSCGTGFQGFEWITNEKKEKLVDEDLEHTVYYSEKNISKREISIKIIKEILSKLEER